VEDRPQKIADALRVIPDARIGVLVGTPGFGDLVTEVPFYRTLRSEFPGASLYWIGHILTPWRRFFETFFPDAILYPYLLSNRPGVVVGNLLAAREARRLGWTLTLDTQRYFVHSWILRRFRAKWSVGYSSGSVFSDIKMEDPKRKDPTVLGNLLSLLRAIGVPEERIFREVRLEPAPEARRLAEKTLRDTADASAVGLAPWGTQETKRWPPSHWIELGKRLIGEGFGVFWFAGPGEREFLSDCVREVPGSRAPLVEDPDFTEITHSMGILARLKAVVANNNGLAHLACGLGVPTAMIFGPTRPGRHRPSGTGPLSIIDRAEKCSPCRFTRVRDCPYDHQCLRGVTPDEVMDGIRRWLRD
jgi:ADP-heptose:LPS heptosyltransferase